MITRHHYHYVFTHSIIGMTNCEIVNLLIRDKITEFKGELNEENMYALGVTLTYNYS